MKAGAKSHSGLNVQIRRIAAIVVLGTAFLPCTGAKPAHARKAASPAPLPAAGAPEWRRDLLAWRTEREKQLAAPDSWLTLVGLEWLKPGVNSFGSAADNQLHVRAQAPAHMGLLTVSGSIVQLLAPPGGFPPDLNLDGKPAREGPLTVSDENASTLTWQGVTMTVLRRGDRFALRIKDADSPTRNAFNGLHWFKPDPLYRVSARWIPARPGNTEKIPTIIGTTLTLPAPGIAEFTLDGKTLRLEPVIEAGEEDKLFFILRDETSRTTTYGAARFLHTGLPDHGLDRPGTLVLDFNELYNPPCAYTPYATCPLPPAQNRLNVSLEAGEQRYSH